MPFVERDDDGNIIRLHRDKTDEDYEYLPHDDQEVQAFLTDSDPFFQRQKELTATDFQLIRSIEDIIEVLVDKGVLSEEDLPGAVHNLVKRRQTIRGMLKDLSEELN